MDISSGSLCFDFEPDTFGHNISVPEILQNAGVEYYYHRCGGDCRDLYRWQFPSGREILVYQEPKWYFGPINCTDFCEYPAFCARNINGKLRDFLPVYGVGDHGGGATRRDIDRLHDMQSWSLMPTIRFSRYDIFQEAMAYTGAGVNEAVHALAGAINTSDLPIDTDRTSTSEGAGVGNRMSDQYQYQFSFPERGSGKARVIHLFNTLPFAREEVCRIMLWNYPGELSRLIVSDIQGNVLPFRVTEANRNYWQHQYLSTKKPGTNSSIAPPPHSILLLKIRFTAEPPGL